MAYGKNIQLRPLTKQETQNKTKQNKQNQEHLHDFWELNL